MQRAVNGPPFARRCCCARDEWRTAAMAHDTHVYGEVNSRTGMQKVFREIRHDVAQALSWPALTELYKRSGYLITLTHSPSWEEKFGSKAARLRQVAQEE